MTYDQQRESAHKKIIPCLFSGTKRQQKPRLCIYKAKQCFATTVWKRSSKLLLGCFLLLRSIVLDLDENWSVTTALPSLQNVKDGNNGQSWGKIGMFKWKSRKAVPGAKDFHAM